jgi:hypothetical protein
MQSYPDYSYVIVTYPRQYGKEIIMDEMTSQYADDIESGDIEYDCE